MSITKPAISTLIGATLTMPDPAAVAENYVRHFGYRIDSTGTVDAATAKVWGAPKQEGAQTIILRATSGLPQWLRFVEHPERHAQPLLTLGWNAIELSVKAVDTLKAPLEGTPFKWLSGPHFLSGGTSTIKAMQVEGPAGEVVYLTQIPDDPDKKHLPKAKVPVDRLFIVVLGTADSRAAQRWYMDRFDVIERPYRETPIKCINKAHGRPENALSSLASVSLKEDGMFEIDGYPATAVPRPVKEGYLPAGFAMVTAAATGLAPWLTLRGGTAPADRDLHMGRTKIATITGPAGEVVELAVP